MRRMARWKTERASAPPRSSVPITPDSSPILTHQQLRTYHTRSIPEPRPPRLTFSMHYRYSNVAEFKQLCDAAIGNFSAWVQEQISNPTPGAVSPQPLDNDCFGFMDRISKWVGIYDCGVANVLSSVSIDPAWCIEIEFASPRNTNFENNNINLFYKVCACEFELLQQTRWLCSTLLSFVVGEQL